LGTLLKVHTGFAAGLSIAHTEHSGIEVKRIEAIKKCLANPVNWAIKL